MRKIALSVLFALMACTCFAQAGELDSLVQVVKLLHKGDKASYDKAVTLLSEDRRWTAMDETDPFREGECLPAEGVGKCRLNLILSAIDDSRQGIYTHGSMLSGESRSFDWSLYERSVRAGETVHYSLRERKGRQTFVIVPYKCDPRGMRAEISVDGGDTVPFELGRDGVLSVHMGDSSLDYDDTIEITVHGGSDNRSFVLLNHNSRK